MSAGTTVNFAVQLFFAGTRLNCEAHWIDYNSFSKRSSIIWRLARCQRSGISGTYYLGGAALRKWKCHIDIIVEPWGRGGRHGLPSTSPVLPIIEGLAATSST